MDWGSLEEAPCLIIAPNTSVVSFYIRFLAACLHRPWALWHLQRPLPIDCTGKLSEVLTLSKDCTLSQHIPFSFWNTAQGPQNNKLYFKLRIRLSERLSMGSSHIGTIFSPRAHGWSWRTLINLICSSNKKYGDLYGLFFQCPTRSRIYATQYPHMSSVAPIDLRWRITWPKKPCSVFVLKKINNCSYIFYPIHDLSYLFKYLQQWRTLTWRTVQGGLS